MLLNLSSLFLGVSIAFFAAAALNKNLGSTSSLGWGGAFLALGVLTGA